MAQFKIPPHNVPFLNQATGLLDPDWYDWVKQLDGLDPLSDIVFPTSVSSIDTATGAITIGYALQRASQQLKTVLTSASAALGADVALNNTANYFDGPKVTLGSGTWLVVGTVTCIDTAATSQTDCKLWDATTVIASASLLMTNTARGTPASLVGIITNPAADVRISCRNPSSTTGKILFNQSGNSKDSHIAAVRIA